MPRRNRNAKTTLIFGKKAQGHPKSRHGKGGTRSKPARGRAGRSQS